MLSLCGFEENVLPLKNSDESAIIGFMEDKELFDEWPERYDRWFTTPIGKLVREIEGELVIDFLRPGAGEKILDAGCGTGVFTLDFLIQVDDLDALAH